MNRLWSLYKVLLNVQYNWSAMKYTYLRKRQRLWEPILVIVGLAPVAVLWLTGITWFSETLYRSGMMLAQPHVLLAVMALGAQIFTLFMGVVYVLSGFYFSEDLKFLIALPYKPWELLVAKLLVIMTGQYIPILLTFVPALVVYGREAQVGVSFWLASIPVVLAMPVLPLIVATILSIFLMRVVNMSKRRDLWAVIGGFALTLFIVGAQLYMQLSFGDTHPEELMRQIMQQADGVVNLLSRYFPPSVWAAKALAYAHQPSGLVNLVLFLASAVAGGAVLLLLADRVFYRGVVSGLEGRRGTRGHSVSEGAVRERPLLWTLALTEMRLFLRNPSFVLNGLIGYILFPVLVVVPLLAPQAELDNPFAFLMELVSFELIVGVAALFFVIMSAMSMIPATTISREGKYLWFPRTLPIPIGTLLAGRVLAAQVINIAGSTLSVALISLVIGFPWEAAALGTLLGALLSTGFAGLLTILDLARPMLNWTNPVRAVKSNLNSVIALALAVGIGAALGSAMYWLVRSGYAALVYVEFILGSICLYGLYKLLVQNYAVSRWQRIDD
ncbi:MAG: hypothetical protein GX205_07850 [Firmicutes bacterium]|nr:hypothetical protein [Bacillota bacterium]